MESPPKASLSVSFLGAPVYTLGHFWLTGLICPWAGRCPCRGAGGGPDSGRAQGSVTPSMLSRTAARCLSGSRRSWWRHLPWLLSGEVRAEWEVRMLGLSPREHRRPLSAGAGVPRSRQRPRLSMLRIKSENGEQAFLLMMRPEDRVGACAPCSHRPGGRWARLATRVGLKCHDPA